MMNTRQLSLGKSSGILVLALSTLLAVANSMLFAVALRLPVAPISRSGLVLNILAATAAWIAFIKGRRPRIFHQLAASVLLSATNFILFSNLWAVFGFGL